MNKSIVISLVLSSAIGLSACQQNSTDTDASKIQESIEKIKTKIQENLSPDHKENNQTEKSTPNNNEPSSAD